MHFIQDIFAQGFVVMKKICTKSSVVDMLTKVLPSNKFKLCYWSSARVKEACGRDLKVYGCPKLESRWRIVV